MSAEKNGKPTAKVQGQQTYIQVERGIYRYKDKDGETTYHERPWIISRTGNPVRTYRALGYLSLPHDISTRRNENTDGFHRVPLLAPTKKKSLEQELLIVKTKIEDSMLELNCRNVQGFAALHSHGLKPGLRG